MYCIITQLSVQINFLKICWEPRDVRFLTENGTQSLVRFSCSPALLHTRLTSTGVRSACLMLVVMGTMSSVTRRSAVACGRFALLRLPIMFLRVEFKVVPIVERMLSLEQLPTAREKAFALHGRGETAPVWKIDNPA